MALFTPPEQVPNAPPDPVYASQGQSERPRGIGLSALALLILLAMWVIQKLLQLWGGGPGDQSADSYNSRTALALQICIGAGIGAICVWQYWKGRGWARLLVVLWSLGSVGRALSFLSEHNFDLAALMGRPLSFFQAVLAVILLYWLNTPKVRAWYKKRSAAAGELIAERLRGRLCTEVELHPDGDSNPSTPTSAATGTPIWRLYFEHDAELTLHCPWRIVLDDNLAFTTARNEDTPPATQAPRSAFAPLADQQPPGTVPAPGHSPQEARRLLQNLRVTAVRLAPRSSDLFVSFEMGIELQTWSASSPKDSPAPLWEYSDPALTVSASEAGVKAQLAAASSEAED